MIFVLVLNFRERVTKENSTKSLAVITVRGFHKKYTTNISIYSYTLF